MWKSLQEMGYTGPIKEMNHNDFEDFMFHLEDERALAVGTRWNYKKLIKKIFTWAHDGNPPKWVSEITLTKNDTPVQPSDILGRDEFDKILDCCTTPRDKALVAVLADSGMRIGALLSCRLKNIEFNQYGAIIYISKTSKSKKTTAAKGIPLTWSTGFLNQWLNVHPLRHDQDAPMWITLNKHHNPMGYYSANKLLKTLAKNAGITKPVNPHSFRHLAITNWILDGLNEQEIKHRAGWSKGSTQMFKIYANFSDQEINDRIFEKYGLKKEDTRHVTLKTCPRCNNILRPTDKFCSQCSLVLDRSSMEQIESMENILPEILQMVMKNPDIQKRLAGKIKQR